MTPSPRRRAKTSRPRTPERTTSAPSIPTIAVAGLSAPHPALGLGLWGLGRWKPEDEARTKATIGRAWERGLRWFDTAEVYGAGRSERILGEVLRRVPDSAPDAFVVTKVSWEHLRPSQVRASLVGSLERLARRSVDLYLVHAPDPRVPIADTMATLEALRKEGRIGGIGVSNFSTEELEVASRHLGEGRIAVNQVEYNLLRRDEGTALEAYCRRHDILIEAYTPLARGLLLGRHLDAKAPPAEVRRLVHRVFDPEQLPTVLERARRLRDLARDAAVPLASIALHWLAARGAAPIVGMSRPEQVDENLAAWAIRPSDRLLAEAEAIARGDRA